MRKTTLLSTAAICMLAPAANATTQVQLFDTRNIITFSTYSTLAVVRFTPAVPNLEGCSVTDHIHLDWSTQADNKTMYTTLLAAIAAGQKIMVGVNGCSSSGAALIYRVDVFP